MNHGRQVAWIGVLIGVTAAIWLGWVNFDRLKTSLGRVPPSLAVESAHPIEHSNDEPKLVRVASAELARRIGIETASAVRENHSHSLTCNAETDYDGRHSAEVLSRVGGIVHEVRVELNQIVQRGDVLAVLDSATVGAAKTQYRTALANVELAQATYDRVCKLAEKEIVAGKSELESLTALSQAKNHLLEAEQMLHNFGFQEGHLAAIALAKSVDNLQDILAPIDGHVISWDATIGEAVEPTTQLFALADTTTMWLWIDVYEFDIPKVAIGQRVTFTISGTNAPVFSGKVTAMGTEVDRITRTTRVRAGLANPDGRLRSNQFGQAAVEIQEEHEAIVVPAEAVQRDGDVEFLFLPEGNGVYKAQKVVTYPTDDPQKLELLSGLAAGKQVVTTGAFLLLSEMLKDRIAEDVD